MLALSGIPRYFSRLGRFCYCKKGRRFLFYAEEQVAVGRERPELLGGYRLCLVADGAQCVHLAEDNVSDIIRRFGDILDGLELRYLAVKVRSRVGDFIGQLRDGRGLVFAGETCDCRFLRGEGLCERLCVALDCGENLFSRHVDHGQSFDIDGL